MISPVPLTEEEIEKVSDTAEFLFTRERPHYAMFTATQMARALATIRALQAENAAQAEALKVAREALVHARDNLTPHPDQMLDEALAKIDALTGGEVG